MTSVAASAPRASSAAPKLARSWPRAEITPTPVMATSSISPRPRSPERRPLEAVRRGGLDGLAARLREALASDDVEEIRGIGHNLKGVGGGFGYPQIGEIGERLEHAARARDVEAMGRAIDDLARFLDAPPPPSPT